MKHDAGLSTWSSRRLLLLALPFSVIFLSLIAWAIAVSRSGFWADDFIAVTHFARSLGDLSNDHINAGRYFDNVFWAVGTYAFGAGSVVPFLLLNTLVFAAGVLVWLQAGTKTRWGPVEAWWIGGLFISTAVWYPTALSASAIGHSCGFLALGVGLLTHERCMSARTVRSALLWSLASGVAWTLAVVSNIIYIGLMVIATYCAFHQTLKVRRLGVSTIRASLAVGSWSLLFPLIYFATVAYPATTSKPEYAASGLKYVHQNLDFYRSQLAPTTILVVVYISVLVFSIVGGVVAARRRDWFPLAILGAAGATAVPALVQSQQRAIFYLAMPMLLTFSALAAAVRPVLLSQSKHFVRLSGALFLAGAAVLVLLFGQGADLRSYFVQSPYGHSLTTFRARVASLTPEGATICAKLNFDTQQQAVFAAEMAGENGFLVPPINAAQVYLVSAGEACPVQGVTAAITVNLDARGDFVATG